MSTERRLTLARLAALIAVIALSVFIFNIRDRVHEYAIFGYPGIFLIVFLGYATVILPAPAVLFVFTLGGVFHPAWVALTAAAGAALGEITGYMAGFSSQAVLDRANFYEKLAHWMTRKGPLTIFLLSAIPNPLFDLAGAAAGALKMPIPKFLFWCFWGELVKMLAFAYFGSSFAKILE